MGWDYKTWYSHYINRFVFSKTMKIFLLVIFLFFFGCSAHRISFSVLEENHNANKLPFAIALYAPDSLTKYLYQATLSGGLCKGHEFQLLLGKGITEAVQKGLQNMCDSVIIFSSMPDTSVIVLRKIKYVVIPEIKHTIANADFSNTAFAVMIAAKVEQDIDLHIHDAAGSQTTIASIHFMGESSGKGEDCHDAVPFLKKAGDMAMQNLRDSIIFRVSSIGFGK
jgi:hypothetical protein